METNGVSLADKAVGFVGILKDLRGPEFLRSRLLEIGFIPGETIALEGKAPFGDPIFVLVRGAVIALRKKEAQCLIL